MFSREATRRDRQRGRGFEDARRRQRRLALRQLALALRPGGRGRADLPASTKIRSAAIDWKEDVRRWHPNQDSIWHAGGFGVFDPGINALSIATHILPPMFVTSSTLDFPDNRDAPIAASIDFRASDGPADRGRLRLAPDRPADLEHHGRHRRRPDAASSGGAKLAIDGRVVHEEPESEYPMLYRRFAEIVRAGKSDVDIAPLQHVADAFMLGKRNVVEAFFD